MNTIYKTKSQLRVETEDAVAAFLRSGGVVEIVKSRKAPKSTMNGKNSRGFIGGTAGFSTGYPRKSTTA